MINTGQAHKGSYHGQKRNTHEREPSLIGSPHSLFGEMAGQGGDQNKAHTPQAHAHARATLTEFEQEPATLGERCTVTSAICCCRRSSSYSSPADASCSTWLRWWQWCSGVPCNPLLLLLPPSPSSSSPSVRVCARLTVCVCSVVGSGYKCIFMSLPAGRCFCTRLRALVLRSSWPPLPGHSGQSVLSLKNSVSSQLSDTEL